MLDLDMMLRKLDEEYNAATHYLNEGKMGMFDYWARQYHSTASLIERHTGIDHRRRYA